MKTRFVAQSGFTLIELAIAIVIAGILVTVAMKSMVTIYEGAKVEQTKLEMESLAHAIVGNPSLATNGERTDFGYVGDIGALPANLDALYSNPGGYTSWKGPYISNQFTQLSDDYKRDAWGNLYSYAGGVSVTTSSGGTMTRQFAASSNELLRNKVSGFICDVDGTPPGAVYKDSFAVTLVYPNGTGGMRSRTTTVDAAGYFSWDTIPIGNQALTVIYRPLSDTIVRSVSVAPGSAVNTTCRFSSDLWYAPVSGSGSLSFVASSDTVSGSHCQNVGFWVRNTGGSPITVSTIKIDWSSPTAYYATIAWGATTVFNLAGSPRGVANTQYTLSAPQTVNAGQSVKISVSDFRSKNNAGGGSMVDMENVPFIVTLGGSALTFTTDNSCGG